MDKSNHFGVIWDLDGVLVDTAEFHFQSWVRTLTRYKIPFNRDSFWKTFGMNNTSVVAALLGYHPEKQLLNEISDQKEHLFRELIQGQVQPLPGVRRWLDSLKQTSVPQAIASSAPQANIDALVSELSFQSYFQAVVSGASMPGKPDPAVFLEAARQIGVSAERNLVIEDSVAGVEAARRAGMRCVAVLTSNPRELLQKAQLVVENLAELSWDSVIRLMNVG